MAIATKRQCRINQVMPSIVSFVILLRLPTSMQQVTAYKLALSLVAPVYAHTTHRQCRNPRRLPQLKVVQSTTRRGYLGA